MQNIFDLITINNLFLLLIVQYFNYPQLLDMLRFYIQHTLTQPLEKQVGKYAVVTQV